MIQLDRSYFNIALEIPGKWLLDGLSFLNIMYNKAEERRTWAYNTLTNAVKRQALSDSVSMTSLN